MKKSLTIACIPVLTVWTLGCSINLDEMDKLIDDIDSIFNYELGDTCRHDAFMETCVSSFSTEKYICYNGIVSLEKCDEGTYCDGGDCVYMPDFYGTCTETGTYKCSEEGDRVLKCVDGLWEVQNSCDDAFYCYLYDDKFMADCVLGECEEAQAGSYTCIDSSEYSYVAFCFNNHWYEDHTCWGEEFCHVFEDRADCVECDPSDTIPSCIFDGNYPNSILSCSEDGWWEYDFCEDLDCVDDGTEPAYCQPCNDGDQRCTDEGEVENCENGRWITTICKGGPCEECLPHEAECEEGQQQCYQDWLTDIYYIQYCEDGQWSEAVMCEEDMDCCYSPEEEAECKDGEVVCGDYRTLMECVDGEPTNIVETCETFMVGEEEVGCFGNRCVTYCDSDDDCTSPLTCIANRCVPCISDEYYEVTGTDTSIVCTKGSINMRGTDISMPYLLYVEGALANAPGYGLDSLYLPELRSVNSLDIYYSNEMMEIELPKLMQVNASYNGIYIIPSDFEGIDLEQALFRISFPSLLFAKKIEIYSSAPSVFFPVLSTIKDMTLYLPYLSDYDFSELTTVDGFGDLKLNMAGDISFPNLKYMEHASIYIEDSEMFNFSLPELTTEFASLIVTDNPYLGSISIPNVKKIGFDVEISGNPNLSEIDLSSIEVFSDTNSKGVQIKNNDNLPCMSLCYLKYVYYKGNVVGFLSNYDNLFPGNKGDEACPNSTAMLWSACPDPEPEP